MTSDDAPCLMTGKPCDRPACATDGCELARLPAESRTVTIPTALIEEARAAWRLRCAALEGPSFDQERALHTLRMQHRSGRFDEATYEMLANVAIRLLDAVISQEGQACDPAEASP